VVLLFNKQGCIDNKSDDSMKNQHEKKEQLSVGVSKYKKPFKAVV